MKRKGLLFFAFLAVMQTSSLQADPMSEFFARYPVYLTVNAGGTFYPDVSGSTSISPYDRFLSFYNYSQNTSWHTNAVYGASLGIAYDLNPCWSLLARLGYYYLPQFSASGNVTQGIDAFSANTYSWRYKVQSQQLLAEAKVSYNMDAYYPYFIVGIGAAWNRFYQFNVNIQPPFTAFSNQFGNHTRADFSFDLGVGLDVEMTKKARFGVGYRFTGLGTAKSSNAIIDNVASSKTLSSSYIYANELIAELSFILL